MTPPISDLLARPGAGVIVPLVTPVTSDGRLDEPAAERLVAHVAGAGCGLLVLGTTGEVASLSGGLRRRYIDLAVRVAARRVPVFACVAHNSLEESAALAREHLRQGADAIVGMLPNYFELTADDMRAYFRRLAEHTPGPFFLYNMPATTRMSLPLEVIAELSRLPNVVGMKDSESTPGRLDQVAQRFGGRPGFALYMGVAAQAVAAFRRGFHGVVPSSGNLRPDLWRALHDAVLAGDWTRAERLQHRTDAISTVLQRDRSLGRSLAALKAALSARGLCGPEMMPPLVPLPAAAAAAVSDELSRLE
ncbi:MAG TPA: dihydrodipicolinate synthase family protein [Opitutaceae bacterium]|nr:dihydrodipicolinate synthase family protein [Opitutaceae bacterium]